MGKLFAPYFWVIESHSPDGAEREFEQGYGTYRSQFRAGLRARKLTERHADKRCVVKHGWIFEAVRYVNRSDYAALEAELAQERNTVKELAEQRDTMLNAGATADQALTVRELERENAAYALEVKRLKEIVGSLRLEVIVVRRR